MDNHQTTPRRRRQAHFVSVTLIFFTAATLLHHAFPSATTYPVESSNAEIDTATTIQSHRSLSISLPNGGCEITKAIPTEHPISPIWQASFPGCGSRMTWHLVQALTGIKTNNDRNSNGWGYTNVVAAKTHYPFIRDTMFEELDPKYFHRAMLILRNPVHAIPSYFNAQYEELNHLSTHTVRAPNEEWVKYRDADFASRLLKYEQHAIYWMEKYYYSSSDHGRNNLLFLSYEALTDGTFGPNVAGQIADFLRQGEGVNVIEPESVPCIWQTVVNYKGAASSTMRMEGPTERPYTQQNLADSLAMFYRLIGRFHYDEKFVRIMTNYVKTVSNIIPQG